MTEFTLLAEPLVTKLKQVADRDQTTPEVLLVQAVTEFLAREDVEELLELPDQPFDAEAIHAAFLEEAEAFKRLKPELLQQYRGKFVAIYQHQVVASGDDRMDVYGVVLDKFGQVPCYIERIDDQAPRPKRLPSVWKVR